MNIIVNGEYNIGHICTRQQCILGLGDKVAFRWISALQERTNYTFNDLDGESNRFANVLQVICGTLISNFGDETILDHLGDAKAKGIVTKKNLNLVVAIESKFEINSCPKELLTFKGVVDLINSIRSKITT